MMKKPVVVRSVEAVGGTACVDVLRDAAGYAWIECRRDPEDNHGWRYVGAASGSFATEDAALSDARDTVGWVVEV